MIDAIRSEFTRYKDLAEGAIAQMSDADLAWAPNGGNSVAVICQHMSGNLKSRFTDFLKSDGEKPWRQRDQEFVPHLAARDAMLREWTSGWTVLFSALDELTTEHLTRTVSIRRQPLTVAEALLRALAHASYHAGQIVFIGKARLGAAWRSLSIPIGQSAAYNAAPTRERQPGTAVAAEIYKPVGYTSVAPYLIVDSADRAIAFMVQALDAQVLRRIESPTGGVMHAEVRIDGTVVMLGDSAPGWPRVTSHVHVYVRDVDVAYQGALAAGAVSIQEPVKKGDDDRRGGVRDAAGTTWWLATKVAGE